MSDFRKGIGGIDSRRWPTASQQNVRYNVGARDGRELHAALFGQWPETDPYGYFDSRADVPPVAEDNVYSVKESAFRCISEYMARAGLSRYNEFGECVLQDIDDFKYSREIMGLLDYWDRTLETPVSVVSLYTAEFVRHVQKTFLQEWPLWRLALCGTQTRGEESILVYPEVVCVGEAQCPPSDLDRELREWRCRTAEIRNHYAGCKTRQWRWALCQLPDLFAARGERAAEAIASFDNWEGEFDVYNMWILQPGFYTEITTPDKCDDIGVTYAFFVDSTGAKCNPSRDREYYSIVQYTVPKDSGRTTLTLLRARDGEHWEIPIDPAAVITDEALKLEAARNNAVSYEPQLMPAPRLATL